MHTILEQIKTSDKPVMRVVRKAEHFKVLAIGLNKGVVLKKHKAPGRTRLLVIHGKVRYVANEKNIVLQKMEEYEIPLDEIHEVTGVEESVFLLIVG